MRERERKEISRSCLALVYINLTGAGKESQFANVSLHLIVVQDRKVIFLYTEVLLTVVRQEIWHFII